MCQFKIYRKMIQLYIYMCVYIYFCQILEYSSLCCTVDLYCLFYAQLTYSC